MSTDNKDKGGRWWFCVRARTLTTGYEFYVETFPTYDECIEAARSRGLLSDKTSDVTIDWRYVPNSACRSPSSLPSTPAAKTSQEAKLGLERMSKLSLDPQPRNDATSGTPTTSMEILPIE